MLPDYIARELTNIMTESCSSHCFWLSLLPHKYCNSSTQDPDDAQVALKSCCCGDFLFSAIPHKIDMSWACYLIEFFFFHMGVVGIWLESRAENTISARRAEEAEGSRNWRQWTWPPTCFELWTCQGIFFRLWSSATNTCERFMIREGGLNCAQLRQYL